MDARIRDRHFREDRSHVAGTDLAGRKHAEGDGYGQVVLSLSALMAMLAVVADGGLLLVERRHAQATADAAALAAASDLYENWIIDNPSGTDSLGTANSSALDVAS